MKKQVETTKGVESIYSRVRKILETARSSAYRAVNFAMVQAYWHIGREIVEGEQRGKQRAEYGSALIEELSKRLSVEYGQGFNKTNLWYMKQIFFPSRISTHCVEN